MEKKKLKKLELRKQTIVDLSDYEAMKIKGGTTPACAIFASLVVATVYEGVQVSVYYYNQITNTCACDQINATDNFVHIGPDGGAVCVLDDVNIYGG